MHSVGGNVIEAVGIQTMLQACLARVTVHVEGMVASPAAARRRYPFLLLAWPKHAAFVKIHSFHAPMIAIRLERQGGCDGR
ncbi:hypothetical protein [Labrys miyagiensis]|uniref:hypothetical protein n=1 Tax=Labrys miyagiensis TaxID=346912 RepID=UPI003D675AC7